MNLIEELVQDLQDDNLLDSVDYMPFNLKRDSGVSQFKQKYSTNFNEKETIISNQSVNSIVIKSEPRYSVNSFNIHANAVSPQPRTRLIKKNASFSRPCKCCDANVFFLDAYCHNCNERMIGNFLYYSFFILSAIMIGFMVFFIATSNPY